MDNQRYRELIVTQWDVNYKKKTCLWLKGLRINSYIVGCKYAFQLIGGDRENELIVTQWDVNQTKLRMYRADSGINSYIVGCKF